MAPRRETFGWTETAQRLRELLMDAPLELEPGGRAFRGAGVRFVPPAVLPIEGRATAEFLAALPQHLGRHLVVLLRAGEAALGCWHGSELVRHKMLRKYVVRGTGRAQATHLKTKGRSREGSRLRLRNARALLEEINERLREWWQLDRPDRVFYACPVRLWADLFAAAPPPPFDRSEAIKLPLHVRAPRLEELLRVRRAMLRGAVERGE